MDERFWSKVDKSGECWLWTAALTSEGYGVFGIYPGVAKRAHRLAYEGGERQSHLARAFGLSISAVSRIVSGQRHKAA
jgi:hypothetical protein